MSDPFEAIFSLVRDKMDLSFRQVAVLRLCEISADPTSRQVKAIAEALDVAKPVVSRAADKLAEAGFVKRNPLPGDRRTCVITVTKQGLGLLRRIDRTVTPIRQPRRTVRAVEPKPVAAIAE